MPGLMAEGRTNTAIAPRLGIGEGTAGKRISAILAKSGLAATGSDHRRVLAVLRYLQTR